MNKKLKKLIIYAVTDVLFTDNGHVTDVSSIFSGSYDHKTCSSTTNELISECMSFSGTLMYLYRRPHEKRFMCKQGLSLSSRE